MSSSESISLSAQTEAMVELITILYAHRWRPRFDERSDVEWDKFYLALAGLVAAFFDPPTSDGEDADEEDDSDFID